MTTSESRNLTVKRTYCTYVTKILETIPVGCRSGACSFMQLKFYFNFNHYATLPMNLHRPTIVVSTPQSAFISIHLLSFYFISSHLISLNIISFHFTLLPQVMSEVARFLNVSASDDKLLCSFELASQSTVSPFSSSTK